jgi:hypothetical protein
VLGDRDVLPLQRGDETMSPLDRLVGGAPERGEDGDDLLDGRLAPEARIARAEGEVGGDDELAEVLPVHVELGQIAQGLVDGPVDLVIDLPDVPVLAHRPQEPRELVDHPYRERPTQHHGEPRRGRILPSNQTSVPSDRRTTRGGA